MADEKKKKQVPLRLSSQLYSELAAWAADDFRSVNGQIEYLLTEAVKRHRGQQKQGSSGTKEGPGSPEKNEGPEKRGSL